MFSSTFKSLSSNIAANYTISSSSTSTSGPWKIFDAKKKSTGKAVSVFVFERKAIEQHSGSLGGRSSAASFKRAQEEVVDRLKREASSLARLRHPSILELAEPVEETRNGGLMFATEPVTASLAGLLLEKDDQERAGGFGGRSSRYVLDDGEGGRRRREVEIDELEIQKGLLQVGKGLEFLHESAGLIHGNLTPEAVLVNAKSDWKISGLGFSGAQDADNAAKSVPPIALSEVLNFDPRLPRSVQLDFDYASPDFVLDTNTTTAADMFSLGIIIVALYNSPHKSPLETNSSLSTYKRLFASSIPAQSNNFLSSRPLPKDVLTELLPKLITRRPAQRLSAREFQQARYFDNVLVSSIRFLDALPAKTPNEKAQFMRGLPRILTQFPKSVLDKKVLPALLEELKDRDVLALVLQNVLKIIQVLPSGKRAFSEKVIPRLKEVFLSSATTRGSSAENETHKDAGLMVILENMNIVAECSSGKEFKDDILPIIYLALDSSTHSLVDASLQALPVMLPVLDFTTVKNDLFPVIATLFSKTSSLGIKVRGLQAFMLLCGGTAESESSIGDGLDGLDPSKQSKSKQSSGVFLDKYTIQEKVVPLLKVIKTKEPAVMMAALGVFDRVSKVADIEFLAMDVLPVLWSFSLGPLLNLEQFTAFMALVKNISTKIETEHRRKLQELSASNGDAGLRSITSLSTGMGSGANGRGADMDGTDMDFESLVLGRNTDNSLNGNVLEAGWTTPALSTPSHHPLNMPHRSDEAEIPTFSWSTPLPGNSSNIQSSQRSGFRAITPDVNLSPFAVLTPSTTAAPATPLSRPLQPTRSSILANAPMQPQKLSSTGSPQVAFNWATSHSATNGLNAERASDSGGKLTGTTMSGLSFGQVMETSTSNIHKPQSTTAPNGFTGFSIPPPPNRGFGQGQPPSQSVTGSTPKHDVLHNNSLL